jgi:hypothetical protein
LKSDDGAETPEARDAMASAASFGVDAAMAPARTVARSTAVMIRRGILGPQRSAILVVGGEEGIDD